MRQRLIKLLSEVLRESIELKAKSATRGKEKDERRGKGPGEE
jgi:hypothetical protein